jgi:signal peptidase I
LSAKTKKVFTIIQTVLVWALVGIALTMLAFTLIWTRVLDRTDTSFFGYRMYIVNSDSMKKTDFDAGDLIFVKEVDPASLNTDDIITFISQDRDSFGKTITHKIRSRTIDAEGNPGFITFGTTTDKNDDSIVTYPYVLGKYQGHISNAGVFFSFLKSTEGYFICIFLPFMLILLYEGVRFFNLFRKYRSEQLDEMQKERDQIEKDRATNEKMYEELMALKAQLESETNSKSIENSEDER